MICSECYPNQPTFWREQPMNEEIRKVLTYRRNPEIYYHTLSDALAAWGNDISEENEK